MNPKANAMLIRSALATVFVVLATCYPFAKADDAPAACNSTRPSPTQKKACEALVKTVAGAFKAMSSSGVEPFIPPGTLKEAKQRYLAVADLSGDTPRIERAAELLFEAFGYAVANLPIPKQKRSLPANKDLADLLAGNKHGITEGQIIKAVQLAAHRLSKLVDFTIGTEDEIRALPDADLSDLGELPSAQPSKGKLSRNTDEVVLAIDEKGRFKINKVPLARDRLLAELERLKSDVEKRHREILITLQTGEQTKYVDIISVLDLLAKAGLKNVTFTVGSQKE